LGCESLRLSVAKAHGVTSRTTRVLTVPASECQISLSRHKSDGLDMNQHSWTAALNFIREYWTRITQGSGFVIRIKHKSHIVFGSCFFFLFLQTIERNHSSFLMFTEVIYISWQITTALFRIYGLGNDLIPHASKACAVDGHLICFRCVWVRNLLTSYRGNASDDN
jgi:hypothetical protein